MPKTVRPTAQRSSLVEMIKCRWREFVREPSAFYFVIFMPILWMAILGFAFSGKSTERFGVGWLNETDRNNADQVKATEASRAQLLQDPRIKLYDAPPSTAGSDMKAMEELLKSGKIQLIAKFDGDGISYIFDPASRDAVRARLVVNNLVQEAAGRHDMLPNDDVAINIPGTRYIDFLVPGLIGLSIMTSSLFGTGALIVVNRRENLLKRYLATPLKPIEYILSHVIGRGFMLAVEVTAILAAAFLMFRFVIDGPIGAFFAVVVCGAAAFTAMAMLCASRTSNMAAMNGMTNLIVVPLMIVGGVWFSRSNFPEWTESLTRLLPLTALVDALRKVALEGAGFEAIGVELAVLAVYAVLCSLGARLLFKWY